MLDEQVEQRILLVAVSLKSLPVEPKSIVYPFKSSEPAVITTEPPIVRLLPRLMVGLPLLLMVSELKLKFEVNVIGEVSGPEPKISM